MKLERWTLFIDMLGYGQINGKIKTEEEASEFISFMKSNVKLFDDQNNDEMKKMYADSGFDLYKYYDIKVLIVSDSVMISYNPKEADDLVNDNQRLLHSANTLFIILQRLQIYMYNCMNEKKILVRGGISGKFSLIDDQFAVGEGIIEAYLLESKKAIYPRIVISKEIATNQKLMTALKFVSQKLYKIDNIIEMDEMGIYYLDYLRYNIRHALQGGFNIQNLQTYDAFFMLHKETIEHHYSTSLTAIDKLKVADPIDDDAIKKMQEVLDKYIWLKGYHNTKMKELKHAGLQSRFVIP